ncbi:MFS transporter [Frigidibacter sp. MR17.24]|uniref:MFS transporter n=1 Tax=Frigidibacter sp. MR17.24 TaxID=3127345 RepID=UPI003012DF75
MSQSPADIAGLGAAPVSTQSAPVPTSPRLVILALALGGFAIGTTEFAAMALVPYFSPDLGISEAKASEVISAYALGVVVGAPLLAVLGAKISRRMLLVLLMVAFGIFNVLSALAPDFRTMLAFRFLSGMPHGAYFGVAALVAASVVPANRRSAAVARILVGLTIATTIGVPFASILGQTVGWRWGFGLVGVLAALTAVAVFLMAPKDRPKPGSNPLSELAALKNRQVWLTLATGAVGFGGFFAVYTYLASTLKTTMGAPPSMEPVMLMVAGVGMTAFTFLAGWAADRNQTAAGFASLILGAIVLALYPVATGSIWTMGIAVFSMSVIGGLSTVLQTRLMDVAGEAQQLAAALNHSAFNVANALGPWLAAQVIAMGYGFPSSGYVGAALSLGGLVIFAITVADAKRARGHA